MLSAKCIHTKKVCENAVYYSHTQKKKYAMIYFYFTLNTQHFVHLLVSCEFFKYVNIVLKICQE